MAGPPSGVYRPLAEHLTHTRGNDLTLGFADIEAILGRPLPPSARTYPAWWSNEVTGTHVQSRAWMGVGWFVSKRDIQRESVTFRRSGT